MGLQCVGLARSKMAEEMEAEVSKCNNLSELRKMASSVDGFREAVIDSISPVKALLSSIFVRLKYHDQIVLMFESASVNEIDEFWSNILAIDSSLKQGKYTKQNIGEHTDIVGFISHCCRASHYTFDILKCGEEGCKFCKPIRLPSQVFSQLKRLPYPTPGVDGHYLQFTEVFDIDTNESHCPTSLNKKNSSRKKKSLPFYASVQHAKNSRLVVQCDDCNMWRVIYSKHRLKKDQQMKLESVLGTHSYTCGSKLKDLHLDEEFNDVEVKDHECFDMIEVLYYSAKYEPICIYCGEVEPYISDDEYPQCQNCNSKPVVKKSQ